MATRTVDNAPSLTTLASEVHALDPVAKAIHLPVDALLRAADEVHDKYEALRSNLSAELSRRMAVPGRPMVLKALPTRADHPNTGTPAHFVEMAKKLREHIPQALLDKGLDPVKFFETAHDQDGSPYMKLLALIGGAGALNVYIDAFRTAADNGALPTVLAGALMSLFTADAFVKEVHEDEDYYSNEIFKVGFFSAMVHHKDPKYMTEYAWDRKVFQAEWAPPLIGLLALIDPTQTAAAVGEIALTTAMLWSIAAYFFHAWAHTAQPDFKDFVPDLKKASTPEEKAHVIVEHTKGALKRFSMWSGLSVDKHYHGGHHGGALEDAPMPEEPKVRFMFHHAIGGGWLTGALSRFLEHGDWGIVKARLVYLITKALSAEGKGLEPDAAFSTVEGMKLWQTYRDAPTISAARSARKEQRLSDAHARLDALQQAIQGLEAELKAAPDDKAKVEIEGRIARAKALETKMETAIEEKRTAWGMAEPKDAKTP
ncbi:MAG: hypothetical protein U1E65_11820 [Myxococcota bacterium]